jgi:anti-anti-sigma factor
MASVKPIHKLSLREDMTIYHAPAQKATLLDGLAKAKALELDLAQVAEIDTAGLQLLLLVKREAAAASKECRIVAHSSAVSEVIEFTRLAGYFGDPMVISARA